jgi:ADP-glucose pyrophosphorylase
MTEAEFNSRTNTILRQIGTREYDETINAIDELEQEMEASSHIHDVKISCADLRFDAAVETRQPLQECERRYEALLSLGIDEEGQLQRSVIFANAEIEREEVIKKHVVAAVARLGSKTVHGVLLARAQALISEVPHK